MKKEITVSINGEIEKLIENWSVPEEVESEIKDYGYDKDFDFVIKEEQLELFETIEKELAELKKKFKIEVVVFYQAFDFSKSDLAASKLIDWTGESTYYLEFQEGEPVIEKSCSTCGRLVASSVKKVAYLKLAARKELKTKIIKADGYTLVDKSILQDFVTNGWGDSLQTIPCKITLKNGEINTDYSFIYSTVDLGAVVGDIKYGDNKCEECNVPFADEDKNFLTSVFSKEKWHGEDFCFSSEYGADTLYISQRVYQYLDNLPVEVKGKLHFTPVKLV